MVQNTNFVPIFIWSVWATLHLRPNTLQCCQPLYSYKFFVLFRQMWCNKTMRGAQNRKLKRKLQEGWVKESPELDRLSINISNVELFYLKTTSITVFKKWPCTLLARQSLSISFVWGPKNHKYITHYSHWCYLMVGLCCILKECTLLYRAVCLGRAPHAYVWICIYTNWYLPIYRNHDATYKDW